MLKAGLILGIAELFITTTAKHLGGIAVDLVSVNPYVSKYFGPDQDNRTPVRQEFFEHWYIGSD